MPRLTQSSTPPSCRVEARRDDETGTVPRGDAVADGINVVDPDQHVDGGTNVGGTNVGRPNWRPECLDREPESEHPEPEHHHGWQLVQPVCVLLRRPMPRFSELHGHSVHHTSGERHCDRIVCKSTPRPLPAAAVATASRFVQSQRYHVQSQRCPCQANTDRS